VEGADLVDVWIVETDNLLRQQYKRSIDSTGEFHVSKTFKSAEALLRYVKEKSKLPHIVLADIDLPGQTGVELAAILRVKYAFGSIVLLTNITDSKTVFNAIRNGIIGYLLKDQDHLVTALKYVVKGWSPINGKIGRIILEHFHINPTSPLTKREREVLELLSSGKSLKMTSAELFISIETIKTHVKSIYTKLAVNRKADAIKVAKREKYI
jgi:DNA-binding NarL/FixJ family response regulator